MSERGRVVLIFAVVLLLTGGAGFYFFKIYRPAKDLEAAQAEIAGWEQRWGMARDCLLGKAPGSAKTSEALAIHEMSPDPWDRGRCTSLIGKLTRGEAPDTGIRAIEDAWNEVDKAAQKAAAAFAAHVGSSTTILKDPLPAALDGLDAARLNLRKSAKLPATAQTGGALPAAQIIPLMAGKDLVTRIEIQGIEGIPSAHGMLLFGRAGESSVQVTLTAGGAPKVDRTQAGSLRAVPDTSWGAAAAANARIGAFDGEGMIATPLSDVNATVVAAVIGTLKQGTVVAGSATELYFARVKENAVTVDPSIKITFAEAAVDSDGRAVVVWDTPDEKTHARIVVAVADGPTVEVPDRLQSVCLTKGIAWGEMSVEAYAFGGMAPGFRTPVDGQLQGCTADAALFRRYDEPESVMLCTNECRQAKLPSGAPASSVVTVLDGNLVAIASHNGVLGVWREGAVPAFYSLAQDMQPVRAHSLPVMAMTDGKSIDLLAQSENKYVVVRIPAH